MTATSSTLVLALMGIFDSFYAVIGLVVAWGLLFAATMPIRQAYLNGMIPSRQRATILSFDSLMGSTGGVWAQPGLGKAADAFGYAPSCLISAVPFLALSRRQNNPADTVTGGPGPDGSEPEPETAPPVPAAREQVSSSDC